MNPLLSIVIPTCGRPGLRDTLHSARSQADSHTLELLVVGDTHADDFRAELRSVSALCERYSARYVECAGSEHCWGHPQRNYGQRLATGDWLAFTQDDNVYEPYGIAAMLDAIKSGDHVPHLFRVQTKWGFTVWRERCRLTLGDIDADCIVTPNDPDRLGTWSLRYEGDWDFIRDTVALYGGDVRWCEPVVARHAATMGVAV